MTRLALALLVACSAGACSEKRKPIARGDGGPSVVMLDHPAEPAEPPGVPETEPNDGPKQATLLDPDVRLAGVIKAPAAPEGLDDLDCYMLKAPSSTVDLGVIPDGGAASVPVAFVTLRGAKEALLLELLDGKGKPVMSRVVAAGDRGYLSYVRLDGATPVTVRVRRNLAKKIQPTTSIDYTIEQTTRIATSDEELEPNDGARAMALPTSGVVVGRLDGVEDRDLVSLPALTDGATYRVELSGLAELALELKLRAGTTTIATARGGKGGELRLRNLPGTAGTLTLRAVDGASELPYNLRVSSEPALDAAIEHEPNDDKAHAGAVKPGDIVSGYLWPGDVDWFCAAGEMDIGAKIDGLSDVDFKLEVADAAGKTLKKTDEQKRGGGETLQPEPTGRCIRLSARPHDTAFDAPYRLEILPAR